MKTPHRAITAFLDPKTLAENPGAPVTITRAGQFHDPRYGDFEITRQMLSEMVLNFNAHTYGQNIFVDVAHNPDQGAAGTMTKLWVDGDKLLAAVEWTPYGLAAIRERGYQYLSAEYHDDWIDNEKRQPHGALLIGAALTIRPAIKRLDPIQLSEPVALHRDLKNQFTREAYNDMNGHLLTLKKALAEAKLAQPVIDQLGEAFSAAAKTVGEDEKALAELTQRMIDTGKKLAETLGDKPAVIHLTVPPADSGQKMLSEADVKRLLADDRAALEAQNKTLAESLTTRQKQFTDALEADEGLKTLSEPVKKLLHDAVALVRADSTPEQIKALAEQQIAVGRQLGVSAQLARMGYPGRMVGSTRITLGEDRGPMQLQEGIDKHLRESASFGNGQLRLTEAAKLKPAVRRILAEFDRIHAAQLDAEAKQLADGGVTTVGNFAVPAGYQRTVIREALSDLNILDVVQVISDPGAQATTQIPYETRLPGTVVNDGIVYEGQGIPRASVQQRMDTAYVNAMKLSMKISNEVMHFSRTSLIDWDAYARNVSSNARLMEELVARRIANELQRSADAYNPTAVTATSISAQLTGSNSLVKTASWPVVRPLQVRDLQGNNVGSVQNPITVIVNNTTLAEYNGSGTQAAGTYWMLENANLGFVRLVTEAGVAATPTASTTCTIAYSAASNVSKFDLKLPASTALEAHLNGALRAVGARKAVLNADRYLLPNFALMSPVLNDVLSNATLATVRGANVDGVGDLEAVKGIPTYGTNGPGIDLGDERILMGERGTLTYAVVKPFVTGTPFEAVDSNGLPIGEKVAYGEEYNAIWVPAPVRYKLTSVIVYDSDARTAAT
jgi:phage I-like protein